MSDTKTPPSTATSAEPVELAVRALESPALKRPTRRFRLKISDYLSGFALVVAIGSSFISYTQLGTVRHQLQLAQLQIRPYVRYQPVFKEKGMFELDVEMRSENFSAIPGNVMYHELRYWVDQKTGKNYLFNRTGDIAYQNKSGVAVLPAMPKEMASAARSGMSELLIGNCVVYSSIDPADTRRWEVTGLYKFVPGSQLAEIKYLNERNVDGSVDRCDSLKSLSSWQEQMGRPTRDGSPG